MDLDFFFKYLNIRNILLFLYSMGIADGRLSVEADGGMQEVDGIFKKV